MDDLKCIAASFAMLAASASPVVQAQSFEVAANGLPILNSNPGALSVAYMDFDGGNALGGTYRGPYGGDLNFSTLEQNQIYNAWLDVSTHFAMFDINVTTVAPNKFVNPTSHVIISPDVSGGAANVNYHGNTGTSARGQNNAGHARNRTTGITHEFGHILGLSHQSEYDANGDLVKQYRGVDQWNRAPMMGVDYAGGLYAHWADGTKSSGPGSYQDDAAVIAATIIRENREFSNNSYAGDGFRLDEHGNSFGSATPLLFEQTGVSGTDFLVSATAGGIIERYNDTDMFSLDWGGGSMSVSAEAVRSVASAQDFASSVGLNLRVYNSAGQVMAEDLAVDPADVNVALDLELGQGQYYLAFEGDGGIGDLGAYNISFDGVTPDPAQRQYELIYRASTGRLLVDTKTGVVINYVLEGSGFIEQMHTRIFPGVLGASLDGVLSETDGSTIGVGGVVSLGQVLEPGLELSDVEAAITSAKYVRELGQGSRQDFDIFYDDRYAVFYDAATGELTIDTLGGQIMNYVLEIAAGGLIEENHTRILNSLGSSLDHTLSETSLTPASGVLSLGEVLPAMLQPEDLLSLFDTLEYVSGLGEEKASFEIGFIHLPGDTDLDVDIDDSDLGTAFSNYTGPITGGALTAFDGDTDGDGDVDDSDLGTMFSTYTGPLSSINVPEPASVLVLVLGGALVGRRRR